MSASKSAHAPMDFARGLKSFVGYLEGTGKSLHTIKNYRLDLLAFQDFLENQAKPRTPLHRLTSADFDRFHEHLKALGLKTNTRRRKLLTVRRFCSFLVNRNKLPAELGEIYRTPHKIERVPLTLPSRQLVTTIRALPAESVLDERNRALLWTLAETGAQVSEVARLRFDDWSSKPAADRKHRLQIRGKSARELPVSAELCEAVLKLRKDRSKSDWVFLGFNKFGSLGGAISPRGVELLGQTLWPPPWRAKRCHAADVPLATPPSSSGSAKAARARKSKNACPA